MIKVAFEGSHLLDDPQIKPEDVVFAIRGYPWEPPAAIEPDKDVQVIKGDGFAKTLIANNGVRLDLVLAAHKNPQAPLVEIVPLADLIALRDGHGGYIQTTEIPAGMTVVYHDNVLVKGGREDWSGTIKFL